MHTYIYVGQSITHSSGTRYIEEFKTPKPPSSVFKVLSNKGYKTQKEAQANAQRLQRKAASKRKQ